MIKEWLVLMGEVFMFNMAVLFFAGRERAGGGE